MIVVDVKGERLSLLIAFHGHSKTPSSSTCEDFDLGPLKVQPIGVLAPALRAKSPSDLLGGPQIGKPNRQCFEGLALHDGFFPPRADEAISGTVESKYFQGLKQRVDEPHVPDTLSRVDRKLLGSINRRC